MFSKHRLVALALAGALIITSCGGSDKSDSKKPDGTKGDDDTSQVSGVGPEGTGPAPESVTVAVRIDVDSFDPERSLGDSAAGQSFLFLYDTMVRRSPDGTILPGIATKWEMPTPSKGVFTIRDGMTCSSGTPLDATAVAASIKALGENPSSLGKSKVFGPDGLAAVTADPAAKTVTIETKSPNNDMLVGLATAAFIVCPEGLADPEALRETPQGSGPYELVDSKRGDQYTLKLREDYNAWPEGTTAADMPKTVILKVITNDATAADLVETGKIQIAGILSTDAKRLLEDKALVSVPADGFNTNAVLFMQKPANATSDVKLRQGMAMLLDSVQGGAAETQGLGTPRRTLYTPNIDCFNPDAAAYAPKYDPAAAAKFLDEAGYTKGADGKRTKPDGSKLTIRVVGNTNQGQIPQFIADSLEKGDFDVDLFVGTYNESIAKLLTDEFDAGSYPFTDSSPLPSAWQSQIGSNASANFGQVNNAEFDRLAQEALAVDTAKDPKGRCEKWQEAEKVVLEAANVVPMDQPRNHWFGNGVTFNSQYFRIDPFSIRSH
ncbi:MAG: ABC transporter substrate-binding protein [Microthrixaceae bacterium]|nr:ABC transporter substrate-binding protein [Microthrixaceae bacterium]